MKELMGRDDAEEACEREVGAFWVMEVVKEAEEAKATVSPI